MEFTYQYSNFGVPGLGLKRGLSENVVIAPYATGSRGHGRPAGRAIELRAARRHGRARPLRLLRGPRFHPTRLPEGEHVAIVRTFMAHHQGMTIVAIANALQDGRMRARFHREPMIQASELLLAGTHAARRRRRAPARRRGEGRRHRWRAPRCPRSAASSASPAAAADHASPVERPVRRDADGRRRRATAAGATSP